MKTLWDNHHNHLCQGNVFIRVAFFFAIHLVKMKKALDTPCRIWHDENKQIAIGDLRFSTRNTIMYVLIEYTRNIGKAISLSEQKALDLLKDLKENNGQIPDWCLDCSINVGHYDDTHMGTIAHDTVSAARRYDDVDNEGIKSLGQPSELKRDSQSLFTFDLEATMTCSIDVPCCTDIRGMPGITWAKENGEFVGSPMA